MTSQKPQNCITKGGMGNNIVISQYTLLGNGELPLGKERKKKNSYRDTTPECFRVTAKTIMSGEK